MFRHLLQDKRRMTLRTRFGNGFIPINGIAFRILGAAVKGFAALRFLDEYFALATRTRAGDSRRFAFDVFALRIV